MRKKNFVILTVCLVIGLSGCTSCEEISLEEKTPEVFNAAVVEEPESVNEKYSAFSVDSNLNAEILEADDDENEEEIDEEGEEDTEDPNIPFQAGRFEWYWIVVIVGIIALFFFVAWLIFFIWDRKDKKKYKKKQQK